MRNEISQLTAREPTPRNLVAEEEQLGSCSARNDISQHGAKGTIPRNLVEEEQKLATSMPRRKSSEPGAGGATPRKLQREERHLATCCQRSDTSQPEAGGATLASCCQTEISRRRERGTTSRKAGARGTTSHDLTGKERHLAIWCRRSNTECCAT